MTIIVDIDSDLRNADWPKSIWDLPAEKTRFLDFFRGSGITASQFRQNPAYQTNDRPAWVDDTLDEPA